MKERYVNVKIFFVYVERKESFRNIDSTLCRTSLQEL